VTQLTAQPPPRPAKGQTQAYPTARPPASEAYTPAGFPKIWRYLYSWLDKSDADAAAGVTAAYPYPDGYSNAQKSGPAAGGGQGGNPALWDVALELAVTVTNVGPRFGGKAVAQAYVQFPQGIAYDTPVVQLRDFAKTKALAPGESEVLTVRLTRKDLSVWDPAVQNWVVPDVAGRYIVWVGEASDRLFLACYSDSLTCENGLKSPV